MADTADRDANQALRARFEEVSGQVRQVRSGLADLQKRLAEVRVSVTSRDGQVTATVDSRGHLADLELRKNPSASLIVSTVRAAAASAQRQVRDMMAEVFPPTSRAVKYLDDGDLPSLVRDPDE
ncbi:YbaB/EbfC family nucleoid-associated protein [Actinoplanes sp. NPDC049265]|uniref:YbaB/EbfC family nucleoid-associated protein n=1 Tax=Actinoplanes sp. NPDC049265 TaxID=3363902 RepID=UPI003717490E